MLTQFCLSGRVCAARCKGEQKNRFIYFRTHQKRILMLIMNKLRSQPFRRRRRRPSSLPSIHRRRWLCVWPTNQQAVCGVVRSRFRCLHFWVAAIINCTGWLEFAFRVCVRILQHKVNVVYEGSVGNMILCPELTLSMPHLSRRTSWITATPSHLTVFLNRGLSNSKGSLWL